MQNDKGTIALDIDGTLTTQATVLPLKMSEFLSTLVLSRWRVIVLTGRSYAFSHLLFKEIKEEFFLVVQNGAASYKMPHGILIKKFTLFADLLEKIEIALQKQGFGLVIEAGREEKDRCFFRPNDYSSDTLAYLQFRMTLSKDQWIPLKNDEPFPLKEGLLGKVFATDSDEEKIREALNGFPIHYNVIKDPFRSQGILALISHTNATKKAAVERFKVMGRPLIVAGDDYNDLEMLKIADRRIVIETAPDEVKKWAHILVAPPPHEGLIMAIKKSIEEL